MADDYVKKIVDIKPEDITPDVLGKLSEDSFPLWCLTTGVKMDHKPISFNDHRYLLPIYMDNSDNISFIKAAQLGYTSYAVLRMLWWMSQHPGTKVGLYFPTQQGAQTLSQDRIDPIIKSCPSLSEVYDKNSSASLRRFGSSSMYIYHLGGTASKDSVPLDYVAFDEVRLCSSKDIDQALERIAHSKHKIRSFLSTCGRPNQDIHARYLRGTQHVWMPRCKCLSGYCDLVSQWPDCVVEDKANKDAYLRCTKCKYEFTGRRRFNGRYIPQNPEGDYHSYHVSQLASEYITIKEIWDSYNTTTNISEFYNAKLGIPYIDEESKGTDPEALERCMRHDKQWGDIGAGGVAMGVDQGSGICYVTILKINKDGRHQLVHLEVIERQNPRYFSEEGKQQDPFIRVRELIEEYKVDLAVIDSLPQTDPVLNLAQEFPGRVFLARYQRAQKDMVVWQDKLKVAPGVKKAGHVGSIFRTKYFVTINRYTVINHLFELVNQGRFEIPHPDKLRQVCKNETSGVLETHNVVRDLFVPHMCSLVRDLKVSDEETGEGTWRWVKTNPNDHLTHSTVYAVAAMERVRKMSRKPLMFI